MLNNVFAITTQILESACNWYRSMFCRHWIDGILPYTLAELLSKQTSGRELTEGASPVAHWIIIDDSFCVSALLRIIHLPGMLSIPSRKSIMLPLELKIIVESDLPTDVAVPLLQLCPDDVGWEAVLSAKLAKSALPVVKSNACTVERCFRKFLAKVFNSNFYNHSDCPHYLTVTACHLFEVCCPHFFIQYVLCVYCAAYVCTYVCISTSIAEYHFILFTIVAVIAL